MSSVSLTYTPLVLAAAGPDLWTLYEPYTISVSGYPTLTVPRGFTTDLASFPRILRNLPSFDPDGDSRYGAVPHDWLYWWQGWGKARADEFLRDALIGLGCDKVDADAIYDGVHLFGGPSWDAATKGGLLSHFDTPASYSAWLATAPHV